MRASIPQPSKFGIVSRRDFDVKSAQLSTVILHIRIYINFTCIERKREKYSFTSKTMNWRNGQWNVGLVMVLFDVYGCNGVSSTNSRPW